MLSNRCKKSSKPQSAPTESGATALQNFLSAINGQALAEMKAYPHTVNPVPLFLPQTKGAVLPAWCPPAMKPWVAAGQECLAERTELKAPLPGGRRDPAFSMKVHRPKKLAIARFATPAESGY
jgi:hypothetical protein